MSYDGGCGDPNCNLCRADFEKHMEKHRLKMNNDPEWIKKMAELEDGCDVSVGGMEHAKLLERLCTPGSEPPELDELAALRAENARLDKAWHEERGARLHYEEIAKLYGEQRDRLTEALAKAERERDGQRELVNANRERWIEAQNRLAGYERRLQEIVGDYTCGIDELIGELVRQPDAARTGGSK